MKLRKPLDCTHPRAARRVMTACMLVTFLFFLIPAPLVNHARAAAGGAFIERIRETKPD